MRFITHIIFLFCLTSCAVGPLVSHESARTVGKSNHELAGGYGNAGLALKWNYGLSDNFDLGVQLESLSLGLRAKYSFLNMKEGWSFATAGGLGSSVGGKHYYVDLMTSYFSGKWEPYTTLRAVHVKTDPVEFNDEDTGMLNFTVDRIHYNYGQLMLGSRFWFTQKFFFSGEASTIFAISGFNSDSNLLLNAALGYRF